MLGCPRGAQQAYQQGVGRGHPQRPCGVVQRYLLAEVAVVVVVGEAARTHHLQQQGCLAPSGLQGPGLHPPLHLRRLHLHPSHQLLHPHLHPN